MDLYEVLDRVVELLRSRKRVTYRLLRRQFNLDEATFEDLKDEILFAHPQVREEGDRGLVWMDDLETPGPIPLQSASQLEAQEASSVHTPARPAAPPSSNAERRQLTVMFCDLVGSTPLSEQQALIPPTSSTPGHCWRNWREMAEHTCERQLQQG